MSLLKCPPAPVKAPEPTGKRLSRRLRMELTQIDGRDALRMVAITAQQLHISIDDLQTEADVCWESYILHKVLGFINCGDLLAASDTLALVFEDMVR